MKICIDLTSLYDKLSGIEKFTLMITKELLQLDKKNEYHLIFCNEVHREFTEVTKKNNVTYSIIKSNNKLVMSQLLLTKELYKVKADKYLFMAFPSPLLFRNKNIINVVHDMTPWLYPETMSKKGLILFRSLISNAMRVSKTIVTVSESSKKDILNKFRTNIPIEVVYNGVDSIFVNCKDDSKIGKEVNNKYNLPEKYILSLGTLEPRKNFKLLLEAYNELVKDELCELKLVIVGRSGWKYDGLLNNIDEETKRNIIFTGFVDTEHLPYIYKNCEIFIFPSLYEGFGIPVIEASAMKSIVLASDIDVLKEILGNNAVFFQSNNVNELKSKIIDVLSYSNSVIKNTRDNLLRNSMNYNWENEAKKMLDILERK